MIKTSLSHDVAELHVLDLLDELEALYEVAASYSYPIRGIGFCTPVESKNLVEAMFFLSKSFWEDDYKLPERERAVPDSPEWNMWENGALHGLTKIAPDALGCIITGPDFTFDQFELLFAIPNRALASSIFDLLYYITRLTMPSQCDANTRPHKYHIASEPA